jgi:hypothetical protein
MSSLINKIAITMIATGLACGAAFAAAGQTVSVTLPEAVDVGGTTIPGGHYTITEADDLGGRSLFVIRSDNGSSVASVLAMKNADPSGDQKTDVVLTNKGGAMHLDKLFIAGESAGYQFEETK